jgi:hypothetical protein
MNPKLPPPMCPTCGRKRCRRQACIPLTRPAWLEDFEARERERQRKAAEEKRERKADAP